MKLLKDKNCELRIFKKDKDMDIYSFFSHRTREYMFGTFNYSKNKIKQLEEIIELKEKEIKDIKFSVSDVLLQIRNINESNNYSDPSVKKRKISELCTDTRYELLIDELEVCYKKQKTKIIELPNTDQSNK